MLRYAGLRSCSKLSGASPHRGRGVAFCDLMGIDAMAKVCRSGDEKPVEQPASLNRCCALHDEGQLSARDFKTTMGWSWPQCRKVHQSSSGFPNSTERLLFLHFCTRCLVPSCPKHCSEGVRAIGSRLRKNRVTFLQRSRVLIRPTHRWEKAFGSRFGLFGLSGSRATRCYELSDGL